MTGSYPQHSSARVTMQQSTSWRPARGAAGARFTLPELLIVIAVLLVLVALLLPALSRAFYQARLVLCVNYVRQWTIALASYAEQAQGQFPTDSVPTAEGNTWDISVPTYRGLRTYGMEPNTFQCPLSRQRTEAQYLIFGSFVVIGYGYWVPRYFEAPGQTWPPNGVAGPKSIADTVHLQNPLVVDGTYFNIGTILPSTNPIFGEDWTFGVPHGVAGGWQSLTHGYADGRAEIVPWRRCRYRYTSQGGDNWY